MNKQDYFLLRRNKKLRMNKLAKYLGCSQSLISRYETGNCGMTDDKIKKYQEYILKYEKKL